MDTDTPPEPLLLQQLRSTLAEKPPLCSGTLGLPLDCFTLYYGKGRNARELNLAGDSAEDVQALSELEDACEAATFGRNQEAVLDESYRKAGKLDAGQFLPRLDVNASQLVEIVRAGLLSGEKEKDTVRAELYNLNVYGKDAFFKAHKDTPRGQNMFGSLVVIFPTPHEGGAFVLRHEGEEWTIDAAKILTPYSHSEPRRLAYVAFFSDVEHEVLPVISGHRVTITYNLYWAISSGIPLPKELSVLYPKHSSQSDIKGVLQGLLDDPTLLPEGGTLGFALRHAYPFRNQYGDDVPDPLERIIQCLKGSDAALFDALSALSLKPYARLLHRSEVYQDVDIILDRMVNIENVDESNGTWALCALYGGVRALSVRYDGTPEPLPAIMDAVYDIEDFERDFTCYEVLTKNVCWMTRNEDRQNAVSASYIAYGNEPSLAYMYMTVSLLVDVGPVGSRAE